MWITRTNALELDEFNEALKIATARSNDSTTLLLNMFSRECMNSNSQTRSIRSSGYRK